MEDLAKIKGAQLNTMFRFIWEPGNSTKYIVRLALVENGTKVFIALDPDGTGRGKFTVTPMHYVVTIHDIRDNLTDGNEADAAAILSLLERLGIDTKWPPMMPDWMKLAKENAEQPNRSHLEVA